MHTPQGSPEPILQELRWLRALAGRLVRDAHRADDAVQQTMVVALGRGPREAGATRAYLGGILRRVLQQERRGDARRERRERELARPEGRSGPDDVADELALQRRLVAHVEALREPYRRTLVLRFLRGLSAREIARREGIANKSVHTRIERALAELRRRLDAECGGDRAEWLSVFVPFAHSARPTPLAGLPAGLLPMNLKLVTVGVGVVALGLWVLLPIVRRQAPLDDAHVLPRPTADGELAAPPASAAAVVLADREAVPAGAPLEVEAVAEPGPQAVRLFGRVRALDGNAVANAEVRFEREVDDKFVPAPEIAPTPSMTDGRFELLLPPFAGRLVAKRDQYACIVRPYIDGSLPAAEPTIVLAPSRSFRGRVVDTEQRPIAGARVALTLEDDWLRTLEFEVGGGSVHMKLPLAQTESDAQGEFELERVGCVPGAFLIGLRDGYVDGRVELSDGSDPMEAIELVLETQVADERSVYGLVLDELGAPVSNARVSLGLDEVRTAPDGRFALPIEDWMNGGTLWALKDDHLPGSADFEWQEGAEGTQARMPIVLQLGPAPLTIRGRLLDDAGQPVAGGRIWTPDTTYYGRALFASSGGFSIGESSVEGLLSGRPGPERGRSLHATTDEQGRFELRGLLEREYALYAIDPATLAVAEPRAVAAGERELRMQLIAAERHAVAGRVLSRTGLPLAGVRVALGRTLAARSIEHRGSASWDASPLPAPGASVSFHDEVFETTDAEGRFEFGTLEIEGGRLFLSGNAILLGASFSLDAEPDPESMELVVDACCHFYVDLGDELEGADSFALLDEEGRMQPLYARVESHVLSTARIEIEGGRSAIAMVREGEGTIALYRGEEELRRVKVRFEAGEVQCVRP